MTDNNLLTPFKSLVRQIDDKSWFFADRIIISRVDPLDPSCLMTGTNGAGYAITPASSEGIESHDLSETSDIRCKGEWFDTVAQWKIGGGRGILVAVRKENQGNTTSALTTLKWLDDGRHWSFNYPKVFHSQDIPGFEIGIAAMIPGTRLSHLWPSLDAAAKQRYAERIVDIQQELANNSPDSTKIAGVDGKNVREPDLGTWNAAKEQYDYSPEELLKNCREIGMTCSYFLFANVDLQPANFIVDTETDTMGLLDWTSCGFFPVEWIVTKPFVSISSHLCGFDDDKVWEFRTALVTPIMRSGVPTVHEEYAEWEARNKTEDP